MGLDECVEIVTVEKERASFEVLHHRQPALPDQAAHFPGAEAEVSRSVFEPEESIRMMFGALRISHGLVTPLAK